MGLINTAKMIRKAQQARSQMSKIEVIGKSKSGNLAILVNGLSEITDVQIEPALLANLDAKSLRTQIIEAHNDARKQLEQAMRESMSMDSLKDLLG